MPLPPPFNIVLLQFWSVICTRHLYISSDFKIFLNDPFHFSGIVISPSPFWGQVFSVLIGWLTGKDSPVYFIHPFFHFPSTMFGFSYCLPRALTVHYIWCFSFVWGLCAWRPECNFGWHSSGGIHLGFETAYYWPGPYLIGQSGWLTNPRDESLSTSITLGIHACHHAQLFSMCSGHWTSCFWGNYFTSFIFLFNVNLTFLAINFLLSAAFLYGNWYYRWLWTTMWSWPQGPK